MLKTTRILGLKQIKMVWYGLIILFFIIFVCVPVLYSFVYVGTNWDAMQTHVLSDERLMSVFWRSAGISIFVALIVVVVDILAGFPLAWLLARKKFRGKEFLDTLVDLSLVIPTAALGFSITLFWAHDLTAEIARPSSLSIVSTPLLIVILLHIAFTYPYMVRSIKAGIEEVDITYEFAGACFGAQRFTVVRTITLPIMKAALLTGIVLCIARSLSETGATFLALSMVTDVNYASISSSPDATLTAPALINSLKNSGYAYINEALGFMSMLLILISIVLLVVIKQFGERVRFPFRKTYSIETVLSRVSFASVRDVSGILFFALIVFLPGMFIISFVISDWGNRVNIDYWLLFKSLGISLLVAFFTTLICLCTAIPLAIYIGRGKHHKIADLLDVTANIPMIVPTVALGISLGLFWKNFVNTENAFTAILVVVLAHVACTFPFLVRTFASALRQIPSDYEDAARTLGAKPLTVFRKIVYPIFKPSIIAGIIMTFTRSLDETGATIAVLPANSTVTTIPVYIVQLVKAKDYYSAALASLILIVIAVIILLLVRMSTRSEEKCTSK
jgi:thiamine transport system permease protein